MRRLYLAAAVLVSIASIAVPAAAQEKAAGEEAGAPGKTAIELVEIEPFEYCVVEYTGSYEQHAEAFMALYGEAGKQGLPMTSAPFGLYWNSPLDTAEEDLKWEIGMEVPAGSKAEAPIVVKKWEYPLVIQREFEGVIDGEEIQGVYLEMYGWITANGYTMAGPMMEQFLSMPSADEKGGMVGKVRIVFPVSK
ncbi:MAG TPA: GyrI-like domain-containing protein [Candidatus Krumholzibacterium sp.]|nr:GyrI-like domain-containing protein [Candidatus Krumholzibacterium sp.]